MTAIAPRPDVSDENYRAFAEGYARQMAWLLSQDGDTDAAARIALEGRLATLERTAFNDGGNVACRDAIALFEDGVLAGIERLTLTGADLLDDAINEARDAGLIPEEDA